MMCSFQDRDNLYLVMDLLTGGDLRYHICHKKRFTEEQTKFFIGCVLLGLEYIHSKNVIHRDIKPENLVCDERGYIAITDFGVAKKNLKDNSSETSGTPGYMAPEVLCAQNHSFPVDFFALGVMGYEFMLGVRPYLGKSRKEIKEVVLSRQARVHRRDIPLGWSDQAVSFINEMLQRKPSHRLGYDGIMKVKGHSWFDNFDWEMLYKKQMSSPFQPKIGDNFDKRYCEGVEKIGNETQERYRNYMSKEKYHSLFNNYTFMCAEAEEIAAKYSANTTASTNTNQPTRKQIATSTLTKYISNNNNNNINNNNEPKTKHIPHNQSNYNTIHVHHHNHSSVSSRVISPNYYSNNKAYQFPSNNNSNKESSTRSNIGESNSNKITVQQRPLTRLSSNNSQINLGMTYRNYSSHHYSSSNNNNNNPNTFGVSAGHTASAMNKAFDLNKIDFKSSRYNMGSSINNEKRLPALNKNSSMKFLNINSNYLSNINFQNLNNIPISKRLSSLNKPPNMFNNSGNNNNNYKSNNNNNNKYGNVGGSNVSNSNIGVYRKSSSMASLKH